MRFVALSFCATLNLNWNRLVFFPPCSSKNCITVKTEKTGDLGEKCRTVDQKVWLAFPLVQPPETGKRSEVYALRGS